MAYELLQKNKSRGIKELLENIGLKETGPKKIGSPTIYCQ